MKTIWTKILRKPDVKTFSLVQSHQGINCYWYCRENDKLYRKDGEDFIYVKTSKLGLEPKE